VKEALPLSDFVEKQQSEQTEQKGKKAKNRPEEKVTKKPRQKQPEKLKDNVAVGGQNRKAATPDVVAENGKTFAARNNSRSEGFNGKSHKDGLTVCSAGYKASDAGCSASYPVCVVLPISRSLMMLQAESRLPILPDPQEIRELTNWR